MWERPSDLSYFLQPPPVKHYLEGDIFLSGTPNGQGYQEASIEHYYFGSQICQMIVSHQVIAIENPAELLT